MAVVDFYRYKRLVQYFWDPEPVNHNANEHSIWCLGREYMNRINNQPPIVISSKLSSKTSAADNKLPSWTNILSQSDPYNVNSGKTIQECERNNGGWPLDFLDDFESRISLTYRSGFKPIAKLQDSQHSSLSIPSALRLKFGDESGFTSDTGWGCMIRSGQSLLANAFIIQKLGRDWRRGMLPHEEHKIISLFADDPEAPYSIHKFVEHGAVFCGKNPGQWFGPSATGRCIQALTNNCQNTDLQIYLTGDGMDVYEDTFMSIAKPDGITFRPTLILIGTRLGLDQITPVYWDALKASLKIPQSLGIAGGQPSSSHYFIAVQGSDFFYLDPHQTQPALSFPQDINEYTHEEIDSCHTRRLRKIHVKEIDPSMLISFLIRDKEDWDSWRRAIQNIPHKAFINVIGTDPLLQNISNERQSAIEEVETFDDFDDHSL
ncbi:BgTH12-00566 [Blumeria graminis f. sp. triticale]|uniref:Cysteine protease n=1 Tax=Blumeria graminis f. sp. triticale TaxID=1689686 RepID=A0A9W4DAW1_BLUGR|nr:BgTH12-00566 [Blumeria graminis f. sp. triticale]